MSRFNFRRAFKAIAYNEQYRSEGNGFGILSSVHPLHPMRRVDTVKVDSLSEMQINLPLGISLRDQNKARDEFIYLLHGGNKPNINIYANSDIVLFGIMPIAVSTTVPEEIFNTTGGDKSIMGILWRKVDAIESVVWLALFSGYGFSLNPPNAISSFREIFAYGRAFLMRVTPDQEFDALMTPRAYAAMLLDNAAGANQDTSYTEHHGAAGYIRPVVVAANYRHPLDGGTYGDDTIVIYPSSLIKACKRYIYEVEHVEKVIDSTDERNMYRITCERYLSLVLPQDYYFESENEHTIPAAVLRALGAINSISDKYGPDVKDNLDYIASVV